MNDSDDPDLDDGGHQPWRLDAWMVADVALREYFQFADEVFSEAGTARLHVVETGRDATGRETCTFETPLARGFGPFTSAIARILLVHQPHGSWVETRIVVREA